MPEIRSTDLSITADGRVIEIKNARKGNFALNKAITRPEGFRNFAEDPAAFAASHGLNIDAEIGKALAASLKDVESLKDLHEIVRGGAFADPGGTVSCTLWAVAAGSFSVASSKVAVAF